MSLKMLGIDLFRVDTVAQHELGLEVEDPRGGQGVISFKEVIDGVLQFKIYDPGGRWRYVRANGANIAAGDAVQADLTASDSDVPFAVIETSAANQIIQGITMSAIPLNSFGWIQTHGKHYDVNVADAVADDVDLDTAAGGSLVVAAALSLAQVNSWLSGVKVIKIADASSVRTGIVNKGICFLRS
jgi:hypothetical protein